VHDVDLLVSTVFSELSPLVNEGVADEGGSMRVSARTPGGPVPCPGCGTETAREHAYHDEQVVADVPLDARHVELVVGLLRLKCVVMQCARQTFREQPPVCSSVIGGVRPA
jgi:transposase